MTSPRTDLGLLLERASTGDVEAFSAFYDLTVQAAYDLARLPCVDSRSAEETVLDAYSRAWAQSGEHPASGLAALTWLLRRVTHSSVVLRAA